MTTNLDINKILAERAKIYSEPITQSNIDESSLELLEFNIGTGIYAINPAFIKEVIFLTDITPLPCTPIFISGIINVHGRILGVVDLNIFLNLNETLEKEYNNAIIVSCNDVEFAIPTQKIITNTLIKETEIQDNLSTQSKAENIFIQGITPQGTVVINIKEILESSLIIVNDLVD